MDFTERILAMIERQKEFIAKVEVSMSSIPEKFRDNQLVALEQLKSELATCVEMLSEQKS